MKSIAALLAFLFTSNLAQAGLWTDPGFKDSINAGYDVEVSVTLSNQFDKKTSKRKNVKIESSVLRQSGIDSLLVDGSLKFVEVGNTYEVYISKILCFCKSVKLGTLEPSGGKDGFFKVKLENNISLVLEREGLFKNSEDTYTAILKFADYKMEFAPSFGFKRETQNQTGWQRQLVDYAGLLIRLISN